MDDNNEYEERLKDAGIRITAVRLLVFKTICQHMHGAFSLNDIMHVLYSSDNSSVFRALTLFAEKHLLHPIDDGSGVQKYCLCCSHHDDDHTDCHHVHLTCTVCHETTCLKHVPIPTVPVPSGFHIQEAEYIIKGICAKCAAKTQMTPFQSVPKRR